MLYFAKVRAARRTHMLRPFPARFITRAPDRHPADLHRLKFSFLERPYFIWLFEAPDQKIVVVRQHLSDYANPVQLSDEVVVLFMCAGLKTRRRARTR